MSRNFLPRSQFFLSESNVRGRVWNVFLTHIIFLLAWGTKLVANYNHDVRMLCGLGLFFCNWTCSFCKWWVFLKMKLILSWGTYGEKMTWVMPPVAAIHATNTTGFSISFVAAEGQWLLHHELSHEYCVKCSIQHWLICANKFELGVLQ